MPPPSIGATEALFSGRVSLHVSVRPGERPVSTVTPELVEGF